MTLLRLSVARTCPLPNDIEVTIDWDIDRWENDGGRNLDKIHDHSRDQKNKYGVGYALFRF